MVKFAKKYGLGTAAWLIDAGLQVSGYTNIYLAYGLFAAGAFFFAIPALNYLKSINNTLLPSMNNLDALQILTGSGEPYEEVKTFSAGTVRRTIKIAVYNAGNALLSNCNFYLSEIAPQLEHFSKTLLEGRFSLNPGERRFIDIAAYNEVHKDDQALHTHIVLSRPPTSMMSYSDYLILKDPKGKTWFLTLEATSIDSKTCQIHCRIAVNESGKLCLEKI